MHMHRIPPGVRDLQELLGGEWRSRFRALVASGVPLNVDQDNLTTYPDVFGVSTDADGRIVVDDFTTPISNIPQTIRDFAAESQDYWIENIYNSPGGLVTGGAVRYYVSQPGDHFLEAGSLMPRAPGAEAPRVTGTRRRPTVAYPTSISASLEVTDEARRDNDIMQVQTTMQQIGNTFVETFQDYGEAALAALVTASSRRITGGAGTFADWAAADPIYNFASTDPRPSQELARVKRTFREERSGVQPDTVVWTPEDEEHFNRVYEGQAQQVLASYGITQTFTTIRRTVGNRLYLRSRQVGTLMWSKKLGDPEYTREGTRFTDVYSIEAQPVFVANGADAILEVGKV